MDLSSLLQPQAPAAPQHGLAGFVDRFVNPTNSLGQLGQALLMSSGGAIGNTFQNLYQMRQQAPDKELERQYKLAQIAHLNAPPEDDAWTKTLKMAGIDPDSEQGKAMSLSRAQHEADPILTNVVHEEDPNNHTITDRLVGVPYSQLRSGLGTSSPAAPAPGSMAPASAPAIDPLYDRVIQRESSGRPGVLGPQTQYGQAQGLSQMLPGTAQAMAQSAGLDWRPDLMTGKTPEAAAYQYALGKQYLSQGLAKFGGDPTKAAMFYHGGPDQSLWGRKTQAYGAAVGGGARGYTATKQAGGKTYYQFPDGWYDNPEGR